MAITKRTRYEILRRDSHTCRYCGRSAPDVKLTVDHVTPTALGGTDDMSNLVAACSDCNAGKASSSPDSTLVADVREDALRHAELVRQAYAVLVTRMGERDDYVAEFENAFYERMPGNWRDTIGRWFEMGVPVDLVVDAAQTACGSWRAEPFAYMCGIVWRQVRMVDELAEKYRAVEGTFLSEEALSNERIDSYMHGCRWGERAAAKALSRMDPVSIVVDHIDYPPDPWAA